MPARKKSSSEPTTDPWVRRPAESSEAYSAFLAYRDAGPDRSLDSVSRALDKSCTILGRWSARHSWISRCVAWSNHIQAERDKVAIASARKWERRRQQSLEQNYEVAQKLRDKLKIMLRWPLARKKVSKDGLTTIYEPAKWTFQTAVQIATTVAQLEAATFMAVGADPDALTDAQARALVADEPLEAWEAAAS
jgi:hypothetical protein